MSRKGAAGAMTRVVVAGVTGWTGKPTAEAILRSDDLVLAGGVSRTATGRPLAAVVPGAKGRIHATVAEALEAAAPDVLVDYTHAAAVKAHVHAALEAGVAVVVGTSGLTAQDYEEIDQRAQDAGVGVVAAGNFSLLAALLLRSATAIARHVDSWEIMDYASATKPDVPSGTARELAERLARVRAPRRERDVATLHGPQEARGADIGGTQVHSVRLPSFVASTEIVFAAADERLALRHDANESPVPYVAGTLLAIRAVRQRIGLTRGLDALLP